MKKSLPEGCTVKCTSISTDYPRILVKSPFFMVKFYIIIPKSDRSVTTWIIRSEKAD